MGADLLLAHVWTTKKDAELDWAAGRSWIDSASLDDLDPDEYTSISEIDDLRKWAHERFGVLRELWVGERVDRDTDMYGFGPVRALISGGMSWGDDPTDGFSLITSLPEPLLEAVGFFA
jgi:hypothetical protein